ncbi:hypothetical protein Tco_0273450 [Tanacetum coccineum]
MRVSELSPLEGSLQKVPGKKWVVPPWDNRRQGTGKVDDRGSHPYRGPNHGLLSSLSKSPREILAIEKVARSFEQPPRMLGSRRSRDMSKYCYFHEDHGHDTNDCRQLRSQIKEAVKSGQLSQKGSRRKGQKPLIANGERRKKKALLQLKHLYL